MQITWTDKTNLDTQPSIPRANKVIDDDMNEIKTVVNTNDGLREDITGHILWTNENPTSPITTDTNITLADDDYDIYEIIYSYNTTNDFQQSVKALKGKGTILLIHAAVNDCTAKRTARLLCGCENELGQIPPDPFVKLKRS